MSQQTVDKVDMLFMVDNSASMGDKQVLLGEAVPSLVNRLVTPNCVDANGDPGTDNTGQPITTSDGTCPGALSAEFPPVHDMHIGIVSSALGGRGSRRLPDEPVEPALEEPRHRHAQRAQQRQR